MKIELTNGMFGEAVETLGTAKDAAEVHKVIEGWKSLAENKKHKIEPYNRLLLDHKNHQVIVDVGSYDVFIKVSDVDDEMMEQFK